MSLTINRISKTFKRTVKVRFINDDESVYDASIKAEFKRCSTEKVNRMVAEGWSNTEVLDDVLVSIDGITDENNAPWPADQQREWALGTMECVNALATDFLLAYNQARDGKTSRMPR